LRRLDSANRFLLKGVYYPDVLAELQRIDGAIRAGPVIGDNLEHTAIDTVQRLGVVSFGACGRTVEPKGNLSTDLLGKNSRTPSMPP
jgi:hypothetical protein